MSELVRIDKLKVGDIVDLQGDRYADNGQHPEFEFEGKTVEESERETAGCICVYFDGFACGFPPDHLVPVIGHSDVLAVAVGLGH